MEVKMKCISSQPTAGPDGASIAGARVTLVESDSVGKGARLELFLGEADKDAIKMGDVKTVTVS